MEVDNTDSKLPQLSFDEDSDLELQTRYVLISPRLVLRVL